MNERSRLVQLIQIYPLKHGDIVQTFRLSDIED